MSSEIQITASLQVQNGFMKDVLPAISVQADQTNLGRGGFAQKIGTTAEVIDFGDVVTNGWLIMRNLDTSHFITWGPAYQVGTEQYVIADCGKILPGEPALFRLYPGVILLAQADTAACLLDVRVYEK